MPGLYFKKIQNFQVEEKPESCTYRKGSNNPMKEFPSQNGYVNRYFYGHNSSGFGFMKHIQQPSEVRLDLQFQQTVSSFSNLII